MENETKKIDMSDFAHNVAWLRKYYCIPKKRMAQLLGISIGSLNKLEKGEIPPRITVEVLFNIYVAFRIPPGEQLTRRFGE